jgi:hypothetical protein
MCNVILDGLAYSFGVLLMPLVEHFDTNRDGNNANVSKSQCASTAAAKMLQLRDICFELLFTYILMSLTM